MNEREIRRFLEILKPSENELMEVRIIDERKKSHSGYFTDKDLLIKSIKTYNEKHNIYFILNEINTACYARLQKDKMMQDQTTTSDNDIVGRDWLFIDIDAKRPSNVSATNEEIEQAKLVARKLFVYLKNFGFYDPIVCMSGNGCYLLYKINLINDEVTRELIKNCLLVIDMLFSNDTIDIDTSVFNAGRICKIIGTVSRKGTSTDDRPHRISEILSVPQQIRVNEKPLLERLAALLPKPEKKTYENNYGRDIFKLDEFISKHNIKVQRSKSFSNGTKYVLEECPFCGHKAPDSAIFQMNDGSLGFKCFHNSCSGIGWKQFREHYEPMSQRDNGDNRYTKPIVSGVQIVKPIQSIDTKENGSVWLKMSEIKHESRNDIISMPLLINNIDNRLIGLNRGEVSVVSGLNSSGKTSMFSQIGLNFVNQGFNGAVWSGEMRNSRLQNWMHLQAAGRTYNTKHIEKNYYFTPNNIRTKIDSWLDDKLFIYNDKYTNDFNVIFNEVRTLLDKQDLSWILLDNLMALDLMNLGDKDNDRQTNAILKIVELGKQYNVHIVLVAHPRKTTSFLRKEDIGGTGNLSNAVDNVFIAHRVNMDFQKRGVEFYDKKVIEEIVHIEYGNVMEVIKNRDLGEQDFLTGLFYEPESKRFLNERSENIVYNWVDNSVPTATVNSNYTFEPNHSFDSDLPY